MGGPDSDEFQNTPRPKKDIFDAASWNDLDSIKSFVEKEGVPVNATNFLKQTAAHIAAGHRDMATLEYLLNKDPSLVSVKDKWGHTVLHIAEQKGYVEIVEYLVDKRGADMYEKIDSRFGNTAIHLAAEECRLEIMMFFLEHKKANVNVLNDLGEPPLFSAASSKHLDMVKYLIEKQNATVTVVDKNDDNILFVCARRGDLRVPKYLLDEKKIEFDVDWRDNFGDTVIHRAIKYNNFEFVKYFVEEKKADVNIFDNLDRTPLYLAAGAGDLKLVKFLVEHGAQHKLDDLKGKTPLQIATDKAVVEYLENLIQKRRDRRSLRGLKLFNSQLKTPAAYEGIPTITARCAEEVQPKSRQFQDIDSWHLNNFLTILNVFVEGHKHSRRRQGEEDFLKTPPQIIEERMDSVALDLIAANFKPKRTRNIAEVLPV